MSGDYSYICRDNGEGKRLLSVAILSIGYPEKNVDYRSMFYIAKLMIV